MTELLSVSQTRMLGARESVTSSLPAGSQGSLLLRSFGTSAFLFGQPFAQHGWHFIAFIMYMPPFAGMKWVPVCTLAVLVATPILIWMPEFRGIATFRR
ncbi:hypothetical protein ACFFS2_19345 [Streptomyces aurantiacus]|uniref:hypothetical protein n=1 Tax=Streptomyces aurantiacus TaxID=47760 RepID=UPI0016830313|nr:hypothetical protein [Streptomyces aurantiacus]